MTNAVSGFSVGDRDLPYKLCAALTELAAKGQCYQQLFGAMAVYADNAAERQRFCGYVEADWRQQCYNYY